ncbi:hypothetical protein yberc0001_22310 [Yersinia bercovieri ATCC 43970]|uniref:Uncharacterized protein n=1 Tax=Yersinia bercovieri ATCC 43970 TaxID=349968 RepID=A0ABP2EC02_YERBE|nr:hypothetical protein yberc0001_22310 [Yersinia bercovieri ATCC 43970]
MLFTQYHYCVRSIVATVTAGIKRHLLQGLYAISKELAVSYKYVH